MKISIFNNLKTNYNLKQKKIVCFAENIFDLEFQKKCETPMWIRVDLNFLLGVSNKKKKN